MEDRQLQIVSLAGALVLSIGLAGGTWWLSKPDEEERKPLQMEVIEASLAARSAPSKQPQKHHEPPPTQQKAPGVSHDETKKPDPKKKKDEDPVKKIDPSKLSEQFNHGGDDDTPAGPKVGDWNPNGYGNADESKGDPWLGKLAADMEYSPPEISRGDSSPIGCIRLSPEGKIIDSKFRETTNDDFQTSAETAIRTLKAKRNANPEPVPTHLLQITTQWLCFKFSVKAL